MISRRQALLVTSSYLSCANAFAQNDKSAIKLLVGASSGTDATARLIGERLREVLNRPVVVISKLGAGQRVALNELQRSAPDGRTLMLVTSAPFSIFPHIYAKLDYEPLKEFTPIASVSSFDVGICTGPMTGAKDILLKNWFYLPFTLALWLSLRSHPHKPKPSFGSPPFPRRRLLSRFASSHRLQLTWKSNWT